MNEPVYETNTKSKRKYEYKMMKQSLRRTFYITHNIMELAIKLIQDWHGVTDSTGKYWVDLRRSWKYIKIPEFINKKYISYFNILCLSFMRHLLIIIFFFWKRAIIYWLMLIIPSIRLTLLVPLRRINLFTLWNVVAMQLNGETKGFPVGWNMTSDYNGVLNNNASKTNRCPEKPYNSDKTFWPKHQNTTDIHNHH